MKKYTRLAAALCAAAMLASCGLTDTDNDTEQRGDVQPAETNAAPAPPEPGTPEPMAEDTKRTTMTEGVVEPAQGQTLSTEKHGYGQGVQLDADNRPLGALEFNDRYKKYSAVAINEDDKKITLTFDQGYENGYTSKILDTLKEKKVHAVFFLLQDYAEKNPDLVQRMIDEGHTIGNHSVTHRSMPELSAEECEQEVRGLQQYIKENFNYLPTLFRPPMGEYSEQSLAVTENCGCSTMLWSYAYADWDVDNQPDPEGAKEKLISAAHEGAIYLLHSVSSTNAEILGDVIDGIRESGFEFN